MSAAEDRAAIAELLARYCRAVDRLDVPLGHSIWHDGGTADYPGVYQGSGPGVIDLICRQHAGLLHHQHMLGNLSILLDGDDAGSETYCLATLRMERDGRLLQMSVWTRYVDRWERRAGRWGLVHRLAIRDFDEVRPVTEMQRHGTGTRDRSDPSYDVLGGFA